MKLEFRMFTESGVEVTQRIEKGLTFMFRNKPDADEKAKDIGSYVYELKARTVTGLKFWGFAVPK